MEFEMTHPAVYGKIKVKTNVNALGTMFYTASTESGVLIKQMTFAETEKELEEQVYYQIGKRLS